MGGLGSGGQNNKGRGRVEGRQYLDASRLKKFGLLVDGKTSELTWRDQNGVRCSKIRVHGGRSQIRLDYKWRRGDGPWTQHEESIAIDWNTRHLGGEQPYFFCPRCRMRVKRLYEGTRYLCRPCHSLVHASTQEQRGNRAWRRACKLRRRVGAQIGLDAPVGQKPKGMHGKTFDLIVDEIFAIEDEINDEFDRAMATWRSRAARR